MPNEQVDLKLSYISQAPGQNHMYAQHHHCTLISLNKLLEVALHNLASEDLTTLI